MRAQVLRFAGSGYMAIARSFNSFQKRLVKIVAVKGAKWIEKGVSMAKPVKGNNQRATWYELNTITFTIEPLVIERETPHAIFTPTRGGSTLLRKWKVDHGTKREYFPTERLALERAIELAREKRARLRVERLNLAGIIADYATKIADFSEVKNGK